MLLVEEDVVADVTHCATDQVAGMNVTRCILADLTHDIPSDQRARIVVDPVLVRRMRNFVVSDFNVADEQGMSGANAAIKYAIVGDQESAGKECSSPPMLMPPKCSSLSAMVNPDTEATVPDCSAR